MKRKRKSSRENLRPGKLFRNPLKRKKIRTSFKSSQQFVQAETCLYLPDDCWEIVFRFLIINGYNSCLKSLSLVSKHFLSVTNCLLFSLTILDQTRPFLDRLFKRFTYLNSLDISEYDSDLDMLLCDISCFPLNITSLNICDNRTFPSNGLQAFSQKITTLTSLNASNIYSMDDQHAAHFSLFLTNLVSINLSECSYLTELSLFSLVKNCPSLSEIKMEDTDIGKENVENNDSMMDIGIYPQLKSLYLGDNLWLSVQKIIMFASSIPSLQLLDLNDCDLSDGIWQFVRRFDMITHLNLASCTDVNKFKMNFVLPKLQVLDLADTGVDDETVYAISKSCPGLLELLLKYCYYVTEKGVKHVVENCKQLRKIEFSDFYVHDTIRELAMDALFASVLKFL
ncbi:F-box/RNI superfamily protein [Medicago truncatula]|uniref:F-box/RNI superfamily protein n=2 Tax=Medicago truncatula TaxID=3880 RepID=A0A072U6I4_MEDTR|nr:F-box/RNI superfamily protein [Medicago truncatula]